MKKISIEDIVVVIRSCGENTEKVCHDLVCREIEKKNVHIINENPFEKALLKSYEIGINSKKKVLITIDADVLIKRNAIKDLLEYSYLFHEDIFIYEGMLYDALLLSYRPGGVKVYNNKYLSVAKEYIPKIGTQIRPETYIHRKMEITGKRRVVVPVKVGLHDYEQNTKDIIRKISYHRIKHSHRINKVFKKWEKLSKKNKYYEKIINASKVSVDIKHTNIIYSDSPKLDAFDSEIIDSILKSNRLLVGNNMIYVIYNNIKMHGIRSEIIRIGKKMKMNRYSIH